MPFSKERLRTFRKNLGLSQYLLLRDLVEFANKQLGLEYSLTVESVRNLENGRSIPRGENLEVLQTYTQKKGLNPLLFYDTYKLES